MEQFFLENGDIILKLVVSVFLGMIIGAERSLVHKEAGMKTHALVALGATVFILFSEAMTEKYMHFSGYSPTMISSQIISGIGFLGAGSIILKGPRLSGLTTAGGLWVTAAIGMSVGFGLYTLAILAAFLVLLIFVLLNIIEKPLRKISDETLEKETMKELMPMGSKVESLEKN